MQNSGLIKWLKQDLIDRISGADKNEPFVWKLKLSLSDFEQLETAIINSIKDNGGNYAHLIAADSAWFIIVYLSEWYKRRYYQGEKNSEIKAINPDSLELKRLWELSGIDINTFVYRTDNGDHLWQYSIYVLGGLAIRHELDGKKNKSFLKQLCRLLYQEQGIIESDDFKEDNRAISFRESIVQKHSLYNYLTEIISKRPPFSSEDIEITDSEVNRFISAIQMANEAVISDKFDFEWVVRNALENETMDRWLQVNLRPELLGRGLHEELHFGRLSKWDIQNPENLKLSFFIRFLDGDNCIHTSSPFIHYWSTGDDEFRLVKWGTGIPKVKDIPTAYFDTIEIVAEDLVTHKLYGEIQRESVGDYIQLWRLDDFNDEWSSKRRPQKDTAVLFSDLCSLNEIDIDEIIRKPFRGKNSSSTTPFNWYYINDSVTLTNHLGEQVKLFNHQGHDHLRITTYDNLIQYLDGGKIECTFINEDEEEETTQLQSIFKRQDIRAIHYESPDSEEPDSDITPELLQFKSLDVSHYSDWTVECIPPYGPLNIRAYIKGKEFKIKVFHLISYSQDFPIIRDFSNSRILYTENRNGVNKEMFFQDEIVLNKKKQLSPTIQLSINVSDNAYAVIDIYRPTLIKELIVDGNVLKYIQDGEKLNLPYILKYRSSLNDFSSNGYRKYNCAFLSSIYKLIENSWDFWKNGKVLSAKKLDQYAPDWLNLIFGNAEIVNQGGDEAYYWDYTEESNPKQFDIPSKEEMKKKTSLLFESIVIPNIDLSYKFPYSTQTAFGYNAKAVSLLKCFEIAMKHETYFFIFWPLRRRLLDKKEYLDKIYKPFFESRNENILEKDKLALRRFAEEFRFEWKELGITF